MNSLSRLLLALLSAVVFAFPNPASAATRKADSSESLQLDGARTEIYKTVGDIKLKAHIFEPKGHKPGDNAPAIIFFFGGGWTSGSPKQFELHCRHLAERGMVAMTMDYRVLSRHGTPAVKCVEDAKSAIRWARANAKRLGIDPDKIAAGGGSAGGHIAASAGTISEFDAESEKLSVSSVPNALVLFNPALTLAPVKGNPASLEGRSLDSLKKRLGVEPEKLSPTHHVKKGAPPTLIMHGKADTTVPYWTVEAFAAAMKKAGNRCDLIGYEGQGHSFFNYGKNGNLYFDKTIVEMDKFLTSLGYIR